MKLCFEIFFIKHFVSTKNTFIFASIKRTSIERFYIFNILVLSTLSINKFQLRFERENVSFKPRSAPGIQQALI